MFRFIHSSDLHLGKRFGNFEGDLPSRLREARHQALVKLAGLAAEHKAGTILLSGDTFDSETPAADCRRQALAEMAAHPEIKWVLLPGNHDSLQATPLWEHLQREASANIILATTPQPIALAPDVVLLPAPCTTRRSGRDLTAWMDECQTAAGIIRLGLAHGPVRNFSENSSADAIIAPVRARRARLDYLALGDWHGRLEIDPRTHYSGTPEPDRFKHQAPATAQLVTIAHAGSMPEIKALPTSSFHWQMVEMALLEAQDPLLTLPALLPAPPLRRQTLLRLDLKGYSHLSEQAQLLHQLEALRPDFALLEIDETNLSIICAPTDLDMIDKAGALRVAADELLNEMENPDLPGETRALARAALTRLYYYAEQTQAGAL